MESQEWNWSANYNKWDSWQKSQLRLEEEEHRRIELEKRKNNLSSLRTHTCNSDHTKEREIFEMSTTKKFEEANAYKEEGTAFFVEGQYYRAAGQYRRALLYFDYMFTDAEDEEEKMRKEKVFCLLNLAACKLHTRQLKEAINFTSQCLQLEPQNIKALFRRARAYRQQDLFEKAQKDLTTALSLSSQPSTTKALRRELALLRQLRTGYLLRQRQMFRPSQPAVTESKNATRESRSINNNANSTEVTTDVDNTPLNTDLPTTNENIISSTLQRTINTDVDTNSSNDTAVVKSPQALATRSWSSDPVSMVHDIHAELMRAGKLLSQADVSPSTDASHVLHTATKCGSLKFSLHRKEFQNNETTSAAPGTASLERNEDNSDTESIATSSQEVTSLRITQLDDTNRPKLIELAALPLFLWIIYTYAICPCIALVN